MTGPEQSTPKERRVAPASRGHGRSPAIGTLLWRFRRLKYWPTWLMVAGLRLVAWLPLPVIYGLSLVLGEALFWALARRRRVTLRNLSACFPSHTTRTRWRMARRHFHFLAYGFLTVGIGWWASRRRLMRMTKVINGDILQQHLNQGCNVIIMSPHFTALEHGGLFLAASEFPRPLVAVYKRAHNDLLEALIVKYRKRFGNMLWHHRQLFKDLVRFIRAGHPCYYLPDQNISRKKGVFVKFFNIPAVTNPFLGRLARMSNASVLPVCTRALPWGRGFEVIFFPPLDGQLTGNPADDAGCLNRTVEELIRHAPSQYFWSHRKFKARPPGEAPFYDET